MTQIEELKQLYNKAIEDKKDTFIFQNEEVLTEYAKHLIEYLEKYYNNSKLNLENTEDFWLN